MKIHQTGTARVLTLDPTERFTTDGPRPGGRYGDMVPPLIVRTVTVFDDQGYFTLAGERGGVFEELNQQLTDKGMLPHPVRAQLPNFELVDHSAGRSVLPHYARSGQALYRA